LATGFVREILGVERRFPFKMDVQHSTLNVQRSTQQDEFLFNLGVKRLLSHARQAFAEASLAAVAAPLSGEIFDQRFAVFGGRLAEAAL
jgi:SAM-dependent MidA family methyltransferase